jgi:hypothetical protein
MAGNGDFGWQSGENGDDAVKTTDEVKAYLQDLGKQAGIDEESLNKLLRHDGVLKSVQESMTRHDELASGLDRARNESDRIAREANAAVQQYKDWYEKTGNPAYQDALKQKQALEKYRSTFGELEIESPTNGTVTRDVNGRFASRADLDAMGLSAVTVAKDLAYITADYNFRFGNKFGHLTPEQVDEFEKFAASKGVAPRQAYKLWIEPKEQQIAKEAAEAKDKEVEAKIKAAYEEGARSVRTSKQWDGETTRTTDHFNRDLEALKQTPEAAEKAGDEAFLKGWNEWQEAHAGDLR